MEYFILVDNKQQGPYTMDELRRRNITSATLVWAEGMTDWTPAWQVEALQPLFEPAADGAQVPPPAPGSGTASYGSGASARTAGTSGAQTVASDAAAEQEQEYGGQTQAHGQQTHERQRGHRPLGCALVLAVLAVALIAAIVTCPGRDAHREAVSEEVKHAVASASDGHDDAWGVIGSIISSHITDAVVDQVLEVDNYMVCSVGSVTFRGKRHNVSLGLFGHVFTFSADDLERALNRGSDAADTFHSPLVNPSSPDDDDSDSPSADSPSPDDNAPSAPDSGTDDGSDDSGSGSGSDDGTADM